jgi:hypothetical protein
LTIGFLNEWRNNRSSSQQQPAHTRGEGEGEFALRGHLHTKAAPYTSNMYVSSFKNLKKKKKEGPDTQHNRSMALSCQSHGDVTL